MSSDSLEDSFQTAVTKISDKENPVKDSEMTENPRRAPNKEIASDSVAEDPGHNIETLMDKYGFFLVTNRCRAVCIKNAPKTVEELEKAKNLKATLPEFVQKKIQPKPNSDAETPDNLLVTLKDVTNKRKSKRLTKIGNTTIQKDQPKVELIEIISSDEEEGTRDVVVGGAARKPSSSNLPRCQPENKARRDVEEEPEMVTSTSHHRQPLRAAGAQRGRPYAGQEEISILRYILDGKFEELVNGNYIWMKMEEEGVCPGRPWQSMKNRFKRRIKYDLRRPEFKLTAEEIARIKKPELGAFSKPRPKDGISTLKTKKVSSTQHKASDGFYSMDLNWSDSD